MKKFIFDSSEIRLDFPILKQKIYGKNLIYFDNAATTQKPKIVIKSLQNYYETQNASTHSFHFLSNNLNHLVDQTRQKTANYINAKESGEIVFCKGATEGFNLITNGFSNILEESEEILVTDMEHHANIVPWQILSQKTKTKLKSVKIDSKGFLNLIDLEKKLTSKTKILAITHASNVLGTINPIKEIIQKAHQNGTLVVVDGTQAIQHFKIDVQDLDADFYVFSGHKMYGPTGIGIIYGKKKLLEKLEPYQTGGEMIESVTLKKTIFAATPYKFEAGTQNFEAIVGFSKTLDYLNNLNQIYGQQINDYEQELLNYATKKMLEIEDLEIYGQTNNKLPIIAFNIKNINSLDLATMLDLQGIAIRTGKHCAQPLMHKLGILGSCRISLVFYNTKVEIDKFILELERSISKLKKFI